MGNAENNSLRLVIEANTILSKYEARALREDPFASMHENYLCLHILNKMVKMNITCAEEVDLDSLTCYFRWAVDLLLLQAQYKCPTANYLRLHIQDRILRMGLKCDEEEVGTDSLIGLCRWAIDLILRQLQRKTAEQDRQDFRWQDLSPEILARAYKEDFPMAPKEELSPVPRPEGRRPSKRRSSSSSSEEDSPSKKRLVERNLSSREASPEPAEDQPKQQKGVEHQKPLTFDQSEKVEWVYLESDSEREPSPERQRREERPRSPQLFESPERE